MDMRTILPLIMGNGNSDTGMLAKVLTGDNPDKMLEGLASKNPALSSAINMINKKPTAKAVGLAPIKHIANYDILGRLCTFFMG